MKSPLILCALALSCVSLGQFRQDKPTRGVWLRPPATLSSLETQLQTYARAGLTDLYLETFYHGLTTGSQGTFNQRFIFDYLRDAIDLAARYNIRVHAWVEAGYWQFQTTGAYNFTNNPEWRVVSRATGQPGGDNAGQIFANLAHPGVQQKLRNYCAELALYPGLWGVQTDYHRMPIDDNTSDSYPSPWSYEAWSNSQFQSLYGSNADIFTRASRSSESFYQQFLQWRRNGVSEAARQMYLGLRTNSSNIVFSGAVFATATTSSAQVSKCQNWPAWCQGQYLNQVVPMAYGNQTSITNDINTTRSLNSGVPIVVGLALGASHPTLIDQLTTIFAANQEDFIFFEGNLIDFSGSQTISLYTNNNFRKMQADFNNNRVLDTGDYSDFMSIYSGTSLSAGSNTRMDFNGDGVINTIDHAKVRQCISQYRTGWQGLVGNQERQFLQRSIGAAPAGGGVSAKHLMDFDLSGQVSATDGFWMELMGAQQPFAFIELDPRDHQNGWGNEIVTFEWKLPNGQVHSSWPIPVPTSQRVAIPTPALATATLSIKHKTWLRKNVSFAIGSTDIPLQTVSFINGDVNGDNEIGPSDFSLLALAFGSEHGDAAFDSRADLDGNNEVGPADFSILAQNFGLEGDF